jgi:adenylylsulfate kinase
MMRKSASSFKNGWCIWITGLPGSGKSTIAHCLSEILEENGIHAQILSSDMLREVLTPRPTYTNEERDMVYGTIVFIAKLLTENGVNVIIDATANRRRYRDKAREEIPYFMETYLRCPLEVCMERESKRKDAYHAPAAIYKKAFTGESKTVPGIGAPYEEPLKPEVVVDSDRMSPSECANKIFEKIAELFYNKSFAR